MNNQILSQIKTNLNVNKYIKYNIEDMEEKKGNINIIDKKKIDELIENTPLPKPLS